MTATETINTMRSKTPHNNDNSSNNIILRQIGVIIENVEVSRLDQLKKLLSLVVTPCTVFTTVMFTLVIVISAISN